MSDEILKESDNFISSQKSKPLSENKSFSKVTDEGDLARRHENMVKVHKSLINSKKNELEKAARTADFASSAISSPVSDTSATSTGSDLPSESEPVGNVGTGSSNPPIGTDFKPSSNGKSLSPIKTYHISKKMLSKKNKLHGKKTSSFHLSRIAKTTAGAAKNIMITTPSNIIKDQASVISEQLAGEDDYIANTLAYSQLTVGGAKKVVKAAKGTAKATAKIGVKTITTIGSAMLSKKNKLHGKKTSSSHLSRIAKTTAGAAKNIMITTPSNIIKDQASVIAGRIACEDDYMAAGLTYSQLTVGGAKKVVKAAKKTAKATKATVKIGVKATKAIGSTIAKVSAAIVNAVSAVVSAIITAIVPFLPILCVAIALIGAIAAIIGIFVWLFSSETTDNDISQTYAYVTQLDADLTKRIYNTKSGVESFIPGVTIEYSVNGVKTYSLDEYNTQFFTDVETVIALLELLYDDWGFSSSQKFVDSLHDELYQYDTYVSDESTDDKKIVVIEVTTKTFAEYIKENQSDFQALFDRLDVDMTVDEFLEVYTNEVGVFTIRNDINNPLGEHKSTIKTRYGYFFDYDKVIDGGVQQISAHTGVDVFAKEEQDVLAGVNGTVTDRFTDPDMGGVVIIQLDKTDDDDRERVILYAHLSAFWVNVGDKVDKSSKVGIVANNRVSKNGCGNGSFVHIEYSIDDTLMCPSIYISGLQQDLKQ